MDLISFLARFSVHQPHIFAMKTIPVTLILCFPEMVFFINRTNKDE